MYLMHLEVWNALKVQMYKIRNLCNFAQVHILYISLIVTAKQNYIVQVYDFQRG